MTFLDISGSAYPAPSGCLAKGLTKREYFAAMALQGIIASLSSNNVLQAIVSKADSEKTSTTDIVARCAAEYADALLLKLHGPPVRR